MKKPCLLRPVATPCTLTTRPDFNSEETDADPQDDESAPVPLVSAEGLGITVQAIPRAVRKQLKMDADDPGVMVVSVDPESDADPDSD